MQNKLKYDLDQILLSTSNLWEELRGQRLFMTGGTGFFGCWLLESFVWANDALKLKAEAHVLARRPHVLQQKAPHLAGHPSVYLHGGDVRSFEFPDGDFSHIIHAATEASADLNNDNPFLMLDTIIEGARHTLEFAWHCHARKFLMISSGAVYGRQPLDITHVSEEYIGAPDVRNHASAYGEGKRVAELLCAIHAKRYEVEIKIARCFAFVGPYLPLAAHYAIGNFIRDALESEAIKVKGDGTPVRSYLYMADLAAWLLKLLLKGRPGVAYNVGSDEPISIAELAACVRDELAPHKEIIVEGRKEMAGPDRSRYVPSIDRARNELGLEVWTPLREAIKRTARWYEARQCATSRLDQDKPSPPGSKKGS